MVEPRTPGGTWFAGHKGLVHFNAPVKKVADPPYDRPYGSIVREVAVNGTQIFGGYASKNQHVQVLNYKDRNLRFQYAAPFFEDETRTEYGHFLDGYDDNWSGWSKETRKDYTNLDAGTYTFRVRAKNVYEHVSKEDTFRFKVRPPWYRTWWAYISYVLAALLIFNLAIKWRHGRLLKEKQKLEHTVKVRTREVEEKNLQLQRTDTVTPREIPVSPIDDEFYKTLLETIDAHLADPDFNTEALGRILHMSQATLWRKINGLTGKTPLAVVRAYRLKRAAHLLGSGEVSVSAAAEKTGFADRSYFSKCFKEQFNRLPSEFTQAAGSDLEILPGAVPSPAPVESRQVESRQELILVVEDNPDVRRYISESLEPDYRTVEAADGSQGIARAMELIPDLIISDIMMPNTDGHDLCAVLKKDVRTSHIPIILLTAKASEQSKIKGLETGADDYITKPFNTEMLRARIKNLIRLRSYLHTQRDREMTLMPGKISQSSIDETFMKELNAVLEANISDPEFNVEQLAAKLYMGSTTLYRKINALSGQSPSDYLRSFRLHKAAELFKQGFGTVTEVTFEVGFNSRTYFAKCFKEKFHQSPSVFMAAAAQ